MIGFALLGCGDNSAIKERSVVECLVNGEI